MQCRMAVRVKDGQEDQAGRADNGKEDGQSDEDLFSRGAVGRKTPPVTQPSLGRKGEIE